MIIKRKESDIKKAIIQYLRIQPNTFAWVNNTVGIPDGRGGFRRNYSTGIADILGVKNGVAFAMEVKTPQGKLSDNQKNWLDSFDKAQGYAFVVRSLDDAMKDFNTIK